MYLKTNQVAHQLDSTRQTGGVRKFEEGEFLEDVYRTSKFFK